MDAKSFSTGFTWLSIVLAVPMPNRVAKQSMYTRLCQSSRVRKLIASSSPISRAHARQALPGLSDSRKSRPPASFWRHGLPRIATTTGDCVDRIQLCVIRVDDLQAVKEFLQQRK
jgi:hypothetical protein